MDYVKIGDKGRHLKIPKGYKLVTDKSIIITKDNMKNFKVANLHQIFWMSVTKDDISDIYGNIFENFPAVEVGDYVIMKEK